MLKSPEMRHYEALEARFRIPALFGAGLRLVPNHPDDATTLGAFVLFFDRLARTMMLQGNAKVLAGDVDRAVAKGLTLAFDAHATKAIHEFLRGVLGIWRALEKETPPRG